MEKRFAVVLIVILSLFILPSCSSSPPGSSQPDAVATRESRTLTVENARDPFELRRAEFNQIALRAPDIRGYRGERVGGYVINIPGGSSGEKTFINQREKWTDVNDPQKFFFVEYYIYGASSMARNIYEETASSRRHAPARKRTAYR